jgi:arylsulfatase I/J
MNTQTFVLLFALVLLSFSTVDCKKKQPNVLFILADDLGWRDFSFHGSEIPTPTIDSFANGGVKLDNYYVQPVCSPTRTAIMTGKYPMRTGMNHLVVLPNVRTGAPLEEQFLPTWLKAEGYATHAVGKWHLGNWAKEYTPTYRGFDSFLGYYSGEGDYYTQTECTPTALAGGCLPGQSPCKPVYCGRDFHFNLSPCNTTGYNAFTFVNRAKDIVANHNPDTPLFMYLTPENAHTPLQAPQSYIDRCSHISNATRRTYCGMVLVLDEIVKNVTDAFKAKGIWDDTVFIFSTDNGGEIPQVQYRNLPLRWSYSVNYPYRQGKGTFFEGGVKGTAFVYGKGLDDSVRGTSYTGMMHVSDWYRTIVEGIAGAKINKKYAAKLDSQDQWDSISNDRQSPRNEILFNFDPLATDATTLAPLGFSPVGALRVGDMKLIVGPPNEMNIYGNPLYVTPPDGTFADPCPTFVYNTNLQYHLYNITADPSECLDLVNTNPRAAFALLQRFYELGSEAVYPNFPPVDIASDPANFGGQWTPWVTLPGTRRSLDSMELEGQRGHQFPYSK